jgi:hypothetical protein
MARPQPSRRRVTAGEALYVLDRLINSRRVSEREVAAIVAQMHGEIADLERRLATLRDAAGIHRVPKGGASRGDHTGSVAPRRPRTVTPELVKSRRVQGEYMGLIRHLRGPARTRIKKVAIEQGREAAIKAMRASTAA